MAFCNPYDFYRQFADALGLPPDLLVKKMVIEIEEDSVVLVYLKTLVTEPQLKQVCDWIKVRRVADVVVTDDCTVITTDGVE